MKFFLLASILISQLAFAEKAQEISGVVSVHKEALKFVKKSGVLFIFAKKEGVGVSGPPMAVLRITSPEFPYKFSLSEKNAMIQGTEFKGPFTVYARYSPSGDALDKSGPQGDSSQIKKIQLGAKNIKIELKSK
jgi:hypothetical protein